MSMTDTNKAQSTINLARVAMPLVELIGSDGISWADREKCTDALRHVLRHHKDLEREATGRIIGAAMAEQKRSMT